MNIRITPAAPQGAVRAPCSKSFAHRLLICAALANGPSILTIPDISDDIEATVRCLQALGVTIEKHPANWTITPPKTWHNDVLLDCGESGSTLRFLLPVVASLGLSAAFTGHGRLPERPNDALLSVMQRHGVTVTPGFPIRISGQLLPGDYTIRGDISSQYATGLLLALPHLEAPSTLTLLPPVESAPYLAITAEVLRAFGAKIAQHDTTFTISPAVLHGGQHTAEGDWSNGAALLACGLTVSGLNPCSAQGDRAFLHILANAGAEVFNTPDGLRIDCKKLRGMEIDAHAIPDLVPVLAALAATANGETRITRAARLRLKESDRIRSTAALLRALGGDADETPDGLVIRGKKALAGGTVNSFGDHRIVMAAAVAAQKCSAPVVIQNAQAINKSFPSFFNLYRTQGGAADVQ